MYEILRWLLLVAGFIVVFLILGSIPIKYSNFILSIFGIWALYAALKLIINNWKANKKDREFRRKNTYPWLWQEITESFGHFLAITGLIILFGLAIAVIVLIINFITSFPVKPL